eukprot:SAG11_NODE_2081_length_3851_cov_2.513859_2_plen_299_part_00
MSQRYGLGSVGRSEKRLKQTNRVDSWSNPSYFVHALGGEGPYVEEMKPAQERHGLIWHPAFEPTVLGFIFLNTAVLALDHHNDSECKEWQPTESCQSDTFIFFSRSANYLFNFVFTLEAVVKILGMGFQAYWRPAFNKLDFMIVLASILDMAGDIFSDNAEGMDMFKVFRVFRIFRVLRVVRVLYRNENLRHVLTTVRAHMLLHRAAFSQYYCCRASPNYCPLRPRSKVLGSGKALANLGLFIFFSVLLFGIAGMHLLGGHYHPGNPNGIDYVRLCPHLTAAHHMPNLCLPVVCMCQS